MLSFEPKIWYRRTQFCSPSHIISTNSLKLQNIQKSQARFLCFRCGRWKRDTHSVHVFDWSAEEKFKRTHCGHFVDITCIACHLDVLQEGDYLLAVFATEGLVLHLNGRFLGHLYKLVDYVVVDWAESLIRRHTWLSTTSADSFSQAWWRLCRVHPLNIRLCSRKKTWCCAASRSFLWARLAMSLCHTSLFLDQISSVNLSRRVGSSCHQGWRSGRSLPSNGPMSWRGHFCSASKHY